LDNMHHLAVVVVSFVLFRQLFLWYLFLPYHAYLHRINYP
jgi:hypothetical protein